jgi:hypothetical protein
VRPRLVVALILSLSIQSVQAQRQPSKTNLSPEFSDAALKALFEYRDGSDSPAVFGRVEANAMSATEKEASKGIKSYYLWHTDMWLSPDRPAERAAFSKREQERPGKCFVGLQKQYLSRVWIGTPSECNVAKRP